MKKLTWFSLTLLFLTLVCSGCGKGEDTAEVTSATATDASAISLETTAPATTEAPLPRDDEGFFIVDDYVVTTGETVNVRVEPNTDAPIYNLLAENMVLHRIGYNSEWIKIHYDDSSFYVHSDFVKPCEKPEDGIIAGESEEYAGDTEDTGEKEEEEEEASNIDVTTTRSLPKKILIDPANQATINVDLIPVGPGSEEEKQGATQGNTGSYLGTREFDLNLTYAELLKSELESRGYEVTMTRDSSDVDITNQARAEMAEESDAAAMLRISMNFSSDSELTGAMGICMEKENPYNPQLYDESYAFTTRVLQGAMSEGRMPNQGIYETQDMAIINWSTVPVAVLKIGYLSNEAEENALVDAEYQRKVVKGIADGIDKYYN